MSKKYNLVKATIWYTLGHLLISGLSFLTLPLFTRLMSTYDYGVYNTYASYLLIVQVVVLFGMQSTVSLAKFSKELDYDKYVNCVSIVPPAITALFAIVINIYFIFQTLLFGMTQLMWNLLLIDAALIEFSHVLLEKVSLSGGYKRYLLNSLIYSVVNISLSILLCCTIFSEGGTYLAKIIGNCAASFICAIFTIFISGFRIPNTFKYYKIAFRWGLPLLIHTLATVVLTQSDKIIISYLKTYNDVGIYGVAVSIVAAPLLIHTSVNSAWRPWFFSMAEKGMIKETQKFNDFYIFMFFLMIGGAILVSPEIIKVFAAKEYYDAYLSLAPLFISIFGEVLYSIPVAIETFHKKTRLIMIGTLSAMVLNIAFDIICINLFGYIAAAYVTFGSKLLLFLFHYLFARKLEKEQCFSFLKSLILIVLLISLCVFTVLMCNYIILRLIIFSFMVVLFLIMFFKNIKTIKSLGVEL